MVKKSKRKLGYFKECRIISMTNPDCEVCGNEVEEVYPDEKHILCDQCGENHANEGFKL